MALDEYSPPIGRPRRSDVLVGTQDPICRLQRDDAATFSGSAFDPGDPDRRFVVELLLDGLPVAWVRADQAETTPPLGDGRHGFRYVLAPELLREHLTLTARLANDAGSAAATVQLAAPAAQFDRHCPGEVVLAGENVLRGWLEPGGAEPRAVFVVEGRRIASVAPDHWLHHERSGPSSGRSCFGFTAFLNGSLPKAGFNRVHVYDDRGRELDGSPVLLQAAIDDLPERLVTADPSCDRPDQLAFYRARFPAFLPFASYEGWRDRTAAALPGVECVPHAIVLVGSGDMRSSVESLAVGGSSTSKVYSGAAPGSTVDMSARDLLESLSRVELPEIVVLAPAGTRFRRLELARICALFAASDAVAAYGDLEWEDDGSLRPLLLPAFDYERLIEQAFCAHVFVVRRDDLMQTLATHRPPTLYDLFLRILERHRSGTVLHVPFPMARLPRIDFERCGPRLAEAVAAHLQRRDIGAAVEVSAAARSGRPFPHVRVRRRTTENTPIGIIVPTRDRSDLLRRCIETAERCAKGVDLRITVVDNGSLEPDTFELFAELRERGVRLLRDDRAFNYSRLNNAALAGIGVETVCFLNNDVEFSDPGTFQEMLGRLVEPDVGAVGILMRRASDVIQHAGVVLGPSYSATHAYVDHVVGSPGYIDGLRVAHQTSAVTAACLMMRRRDFLAVGGFDETAFPVAFNDVDLCLKLRRAGKRIVMTPHAVVTHHESVSRGSDMTALRRPLFARELSNLRERWHAMLGDDPFYNPFLDRSAHPYSGLNVAAPAVEAREQRFEL